MSHMSEMKLANRVPEKSFVQIMALSISLDDPGYKELIGDANSHQYHDLLYHLQDQVGVNTLFSKEMHQLQRNWPRDLEKKQT